MPDSTTVPDDPVRPADAYSEHAPPASLARYVECFWTRGGSSAPALRFHRVMPDGCADIVFAFDAAGASPTGVAVGAMTGPVMFADIGDTSYVGVRFRSGVAGVLFGVPAVELTDERPALGLVWPSAGTLGEKLVGLDTSGRLKALSAEIARRLLAVSAGPPPMVLAAIERITASQGRLAIRSLAGDLGVTRQHLARSFARHVGLSPKMLARVVRARSVVDYVRRAREVEWTTFALDAGYYDQSHLIAEVKELTGLSPGTWLSGLA